MLYYLEPFIFLYRLLVYDGLVLVGGSSDRILLLIFLNTSALLANIESLFRRQRVAREHFAENIG